MAQGGAKRRRFGDGARRVLDALAWWWCSPEERAAAEAAGAGHEVPADQLRSVPSRTVRCSGVQYRAYRALARSCRRRSLLLLPIASPVAPLAVLWTGVTNLVDLTYTAFMVAISLAFNPAGRSDAVPWLTYCDLVGSCVYITDLVMGFHIGVVARWDARAVVVRDWRTAAAYYLRHGFFLDAIATLPCLIQLFMWALDSPIHALRFLYVLRLLRLARVVRLLHEVQPGRGGGPLKVVYALLRVRTLLLITALFSMAVLVNLLGCIWWNLAIASGNIYDSWASPDILVSKQYNLADASNVQRWLVSCYFASTTVLTIGYGDIVPVTTSETAVVLLFQIIGVAFFGYMLNTITSILAASGRSARRQEALRNKLEEVEDVLDTLGGQTPSANLQGKIRLFFSEQWQPPEVDQYALYRDLPPKLRRMAVQERQAPALAELGFFPADMPAKQRKAAAAILAAASTPVWLPAGGELGEAVADPAGVDAAPQGRGPAAPPPADTPGAAGPACYLLDEGELRALRAGESAARAGRHRLGGRVDFAGPAFIGLAALFTPMAAGGDSSSSSDDEAGDGGGGGGGGIKGKNSKLGLSPDWTGVSAELEALGGAWRQRAVALTGCHLWRIDAHQLFHELHARQPAVLRHIITNLLGRLGVRTEAPPVAGNGATATRRALLARLKGGAAAAEEAAGAGEPQQQGEQQGEQQQAAEQPASAQQRAVDRLLWLRAQLDAQIARGGGEDADEADDDDASSLATFAQRSAWSAASGDGLGGPGSPASPLGDVEAGGGKRGGDDEGDASAQGPDVWSAG